MIIHWASLRRHLPHKDYYATIFQDGEDFMVTIQGKQDKVTYPTGDEAWQRAKEGLEELIDQEQLI